MEYARRCPSNEPEGKWSVNRDDSDLDLLVVEPNVVSKRDEMVRLRRLLRPFRVPVDVIVVSETEFNDWAPLAGTIHYWASREGKLLHEATR